jgi:predicted XRE-type DNA-binding protein
VEPTRLLPKDASAVDKLKFEVCKQFVIHLREHEMSQSELAKQLGIDRARMNEIVKYRIDRFTADKLMEYALRLDPSLRFTVA